MRAVSFRTRAGPGWRVFLVVMVRGAGQITLSGDTRDWATWRQLNPGHCAAWVPAETGAMPTGGVRADAGLRPAVPAWRPAFRCGRPPFALVRVRPAAPLRGAVPAWRPAFRCGRPPFALVRVRPAAPLRGAVPAWRPAFRCGRPPFALVRVRPAARLRRAVPAWRPAFPCPCDIKAGGASPGYGGGGRRADARGRQVWACLGNPALALVLALPDFDVNLPGGEAVAARVEDDGAFLARVQRQ